MGQGDEVQGETLTGEGKEWVEERLCWEGGLGCGVGCPGCLRFDLGIKSSP